MALLFPLLLVSNLASRHLTERSIAPDEESPSSLFAERLLVDVLLSMLEAVEDIDESAPLGDTYDTRCH